MTDPHVASLTYEFLVIGQGHDFAEAGPLDVELAGFHCHLADDKLVAVPHDHYATIDEARQVLELRLGDWEAVAELTTHARVEFRFVQGSLIDRSPGADLASLGGTVELSVGLGGLWVKHESYPAAPSSHFHATDLVVALTRRLGNARRSGEPLLSAANWVLTRLEEEYGSRRGVAQELNVSLPVLRRLGKVASYNDPLLGQSSPRTWCRRSSVGRSASQAASSSITSSSFGRWSRSSRSGSIDPADR